MSGPAFEPAKHLAAEHHGPPAHAISTFVVRKVNKRLGIYEVETGRRVYSPPDFIRLHSRQAIIDLADTFREAQWDQKWRPIDSIISFEAAHHPRKTRERHRGASAGTERHIEASTPAASPREAETRS